MSRLSKTLSLLAAAGMALLASPATRIEAADPVISSLEGMLVRPGGGGSELFGIRLAVSGDTAVVSSLPNSSAATGSVQVFIRAGGVWTWQAQLLHPQPAGGDQFGASVAIDGDTVVVGVPGDDNPLTGGPRPSAQVYVRSGTTWAHEAELFHPDAATPAGSGSTGFGAAVAVQGDIAVVGSPMDNVTGVDANGARSSDGSAQVYVRTGTTWAHVTEVIDPAVMTNPAAARGDLFGSVLAFDGGALVVGAPRDDTKGTDAGEAHVFTVTAGTSSHVFTLTAPDGAAFDQFGASVAVSDATVLVGAPFDATAAGGGAGSAHAFVAGAYQGKLVHPAGAAGDQLGTSVAVSGDLALVAAPADDTVTGTGGVDAGSVLVFLRSGGSWAFAVELRHPDDIAGFAGDKYGTRVALDGETAIVGAPFDNNDNGSDAGAAFVSKLQSGTPPPVDPIAIAGPDQTVAEQAAVVLDGSGSSDPNGDALHFHWEQVAGPAAALSDPAAVQPGFVAPTVPTGGATLTFRLTVDDGTHASAPDTVDITVTNVNQVPMAEAGGDQTVQEGSAVALQGGDSFDGDGDPLTFEWTQTSGPAVTLTDANTASAAFTAPAVGSGGQTLTFTLTVSDGTEQSTDEVQVFVSNVNQEPVAKAGSDLTADEGTQVTLQGTASTDPDGDPLTYSWTQAGGTAVTLSDPSAATPSFIAPAVGPDGETLVFQLVVGDGEASSADTVTVTVRNLNQPPSCGLARASATLLWPPSHRLISVGIAGVADTEDPDVTIAVTAVTQDEPVNGLGDGDTSPDAVLQGPSALVRAERSGLGTGRVYTLTFTASDSNGAACTGSVTVCVPHDRRADACTDEGQAYDSRLP